LPNLSTTPILVVTGVILVAISIPTATTKTSVTTLASIPLLLLTGGRATISRTGTPLSLDSGPLTSFLSRMSSVNCASPSTTQLYIVHSFGAVVSSPLPTLLLVMFLTTLGSQTDYASYLGNDHLHVGDDKGLAISYIGHSTLHSPKCIFKLSNVLHVPHITKPLLFIDKFYHDNNVYFEFHVSVFYIKDIITKKVLLFGQSNDGLYVLSESSATSIPQTYWSLCVSATADL
jgi:hypothetical protein